MVLLNERKKSNFVLNLVLLLYLYVLFAPDRIKHLLSFTLENKSITNELWLIPVIIFLSFLLKSGYRIKPISKYNFYLSICIYLYIIIILIGGFGAFSITQFIYAGFIFIVPIFLFYVISYLEVVQIKYLIRRFIIINLIYSTFAIILTTNYVFFMNLIGNSVEDYRYYSQYRSSMMLGSSITVSYYLNLTLPFCMYLLFSDEEKKWRIIAALTVGTNIIATLVLLSRNASVTMVVIILFFLLFMRIKSKNYTTKFILLFLLIISGFLAVYQYDLSRLFTVFGGSFTQRLSASSLGLYIFSQYPIFGSGVGNFFERIYDDKYISIDGILGLIDPHNLYILILSELGIAGFIVTIFMIYVLFRSFSKIKNKLLRNTAYISLITFLINAMGGSHLMNEISYSVIFWIYMGVYNAISIKDEGKE